MALMQVNSSLAVQGAVVLAKDESEFPPNPQIGTMIIKDQVLYAWIKIGGLETWYPFASKTNSYVHVQAMPSTTWIIGHNLGTMNVWSQIKDANGAIVTANTVAIDSNTIRITFTTATTGSVIVVAPDTIDVPLVKSAAVVIGNNEEVVIDTSGVRINGSYALTAASIEQQIADAVAVETTRALAAEAALSDQIANVYTRAQIDSLVINGGSY